MRRRIYHICLIIFFTFIFSSQIFASTYLENLKPDQKIHGFSTLNLYVNSANKVMGARFISEKYGFIIDLMEIQSVPQGFFWIKTLPKSDKGLPHTCEHLLLGKGNRGRYVAALEDMSLGSSSAYTAQVRTCYHFNTIAGSESFYKILEAKLMAFLHPDFTDEEISREVCHIGVIKDNQTGKLSLEEKGTIYTEMVSSFEKPWYYYYNTMHKLLYGEVHPLSYVSGGVPEAIRKVKHQDLWDFHKKTHHLANMGMIIAIPDEISVESFLINIDKILNDCQKTTTKSKYIGISEYPLPEPKPAPFGTIKLVTYPSESREDPGSMYFSWPAHLKLDNRQKILLNLFLTALSEGQTSNLYDIFINSKTRKISIGGNNVWKWDPNYQGNPIWIALVGLDNTYIDKNMIDSVRAMIVSEIKRIYNFEDGGKNLIDFNNKVESHLTQIRKEKEDYLNSPPMFGFRSFVASGWISNLELLEKDEEFRKSLVFKSHFAYAESLLATGINFWEELIDSCKLLTYLPYAVGSSPDPGILNEMRDAKEKRIVEYINDLKKKYGIDEDQKAIAMYKEGFDSKTAELERIASKQKLPGFTDNPPLTLDDQLKYETINLPGNIPLVASTFENISSSTIGIALKLDVIPEQHLIYVPFLPDILTSIGVIEDGEALSFKEMQERIRREVLRFETEFDFGFQTDRIELVLKGASSNQGELENLIKWMNLSLYSPYLREDNIPRMLDILDQSLISLRNTMKGSEEVWVSYPAYAYRFQTNPLFMSANTFLTKIHHLHRLRFMLTDPGTENEQKEISNFLNSLSEFGRVKNRHEMTKLLLTLLNDKGYDDEFIRDFKPRIFNMTEKAKANAILSLRAIKASLPEIPDENLDEDWIYLCNEIKRDILIKPKKAIKDMKMILDLICKADNARMFMISNSEDRNSVLNNIEDFVDKLDIENVSKRVQYDTKNYIIERLKSRIPGVEKPIYVGLVHDGTRNGVIISGARYAAEYDTTTSSILDCLAGKLYSGGGGHSLFMKTWSAGLAYSNGFGINESSGRAGYYAERCPDVAETMRFVVNELKNREEDLSLVDYAIAQVFGSSRSASRYEVRGQMMASNIADGYTPLMVKTYRMRVLELREMDNLYEELAKRIESVYGSVLIGYGKPLSESNDGYLFLIGPEKQFESLENYIEVTEGRETVYRLYPRDYWLVQKL